MANQRILDGYTNNSGWDYRVIVEETSQSIENNTTTIRWYTQFGRLGSNSYMTNAYIDETFWVNGSKYTRRVYLYRGNENHKVFTQGAWESTRTGNSIDSNYYPTSPVAYEYATIKHNNDGKKTISISASASLDVTPSSATLGASNYVLTAIPRDPIAKFKLSGSWIDGKARIKVDGSWLKAKKIFNKVNGAWVEDKLRG